MTHSVLCRYAVIIVAFITLSLSTAHADQASNPYLSALKDGDVDQAATLAEKFLQVDHNDRIARLVLGVRALKQRQYILARQNFSQSVHGPVTDLTAALLSAWAIYGSGDTRGAVDEMDKLTGPDWYGIFKDLHAGLILDLANRKKDAGKRYESAYKTDSTALRLVQAYGRYLSRNGSKDAALKVYRDFDAQLPNHPLIQQEIKQVLDGATLPPLVDSTQDGAAEALYGIGASIGRRGGEDLALVYLQLALYLDPSHGMALLSLADLYESLKKPDLAIKVYERVPATSPLSRNAQIQSAVDLDALNRTDEAKNRLDQVIAEHPNDPEALTALGNIERGRQDFAACAETYGKAIATIPQPTKSNWVMFYFRGICYERANQWPSAEADMKKALELFPDQPLVLNYLGYSWVDRGINLEQATDMIRRALEQRPDDGYIADSLGWAYFRTGNYDEALRNLERAVGLQPKDPAIRDHLGDAYWKLGRNSEARVQWTQARDLKPEPDALAKIDEKLQLRPAEVVSASTSDVTKALSDKRVAPRVALVVGNSAYINVARLTNPANDARLMADTLRSLGFALVGGGAQLDLDEGNFRRVVQDFGTQLQGADVGLFYYAGHGIQVRGANYLVPVSANPTKEADVDFQLLDSNVVLRQMESAGTKLNLVILDACRNNPFGGRGLRGTDAGLAQMRAPEGTLISFATQPGAVAQDGAGGNSPYTAALAQTMRKPGLDVFKTFNEVGLAVASATGGAQQPWVSLSPIKGDFYFTGAPPGAPGVPASSGAGAPTADEIFWLTIKDSSVPALFDEFLNKFPSSAHVVEARARSEELKKSKVAVVAPPIVPAAPSAACGGASTVSLSRGAAPLSAAEECGLKPKDTFKECATCPEMVVVPAGAFIMGSSGISPNYADVPPHRVNIAKQFAIGKFEVTVDQFAAFVRESGYSTGTKCWTIEGNAGERSGRSWRNPGFSQRGNHPAVCLDWEDSENYVNWLSHKTGRPYRLLSEAEWEYVARSGSTTKYFFGDDANDICKYANVLDLAASNQFKIQTLPCSDGHVFTSPVGSFKPNLFGVYDMLGNASEWVADCRNDRYLGAPQDGSAWITGDCTEHMIRGMNWHSNAADFFRSSYRSSAFTSHDRDNTIGLRVARMLAQ